MANKTWSVFGFSCSILASILAAPTFSLGQQIEARSLVEAYEAQTSAWTTGDVLFRVESFYDGSNSEDVGRFEDSVAFHRYIFDKPNDRYFYYGVVETNRGNVQAKDEPATEQWSSIRSAFVYQNGAAMIRQFPNRAFRLQTDQVNEVQERSEFAPSNLENIGFSAFDRSNRRSRMTPVNDRVGEEIIAYEKTSTIVFHWFSLNKPIEPEVFKINLDNLAELELLISPKATRATAILESL